MLSLEQQDGHIREAVGVFTDKQALNAAVAELEVTAFPRQDISVLDPDGETPASIAEDSPTAARTILVRPEEQTVFAGVLICGGAYAGAVTAMMIIGLNSGVLPLLGMALFGAVGGSSLGAIVVQVLALRLRQNWEKTVSRGGSVLWVRTPEPDSERKALHIMRKHGGRDVHVHTTH
jgi:hypothetical protein